VFKKKVKRPYKNKIKRDANINNVKKLVFVPLMCQMVHETDLLFREAQCA